MDNLLYDCERCGGHGGTYMDDGYLPCFNCGDSGFTNRKPSWMVEGPFCRGIVTTPYYRQGWYYSGPEANKPTPPPSLEPCESSSTFHCNIDQEISGMPNLSENPLGWA